MPRGPRLVLPNYPFHVIQRGVNRAAMFVDDLDRHHYCRLLGRACSKQSVALHAFVLMGNHVHLLLTPSTAQALALAMRSTGQSYVRYFNTRHGRSGTLWEGRYKSCLVDTDRYFLMVLRYIELNPVRAALVASPQDHYWSSVRTHLGLARHPLLTPHPVYLSLGEPPAHRADAYGHFLHAGISDVELANIQRYVQQERALGDERFQRMVAEALNRETAFRPPGRPRGKG